MSFFLSERLALSSSLRETLKQIPFGLRWVSDCPEVAKGVLCWADLA